MNQHVKDEFTGNVREIANRLRGPYRPPQYRLVMPPMVVRRSLDCVLATMRDKVVGRTPQGVTAMPG